MFFEKLFAFFTFAAAGPEHCHIILKVPSKTKAEVITASIIFIVKINDREVILIQYIMNLFIKSWVMYLAISWLSLTYRNLFSGFLKICIFLSTGMGIYKRKNEKKRTRTRPRKHGRVHEKKNRSRKHALDQESVHEKRIC